MNTDKRRFAFCKRLEKISVISVPLFLRPVAKEHGDAGQNKADGPDHAPGDGLEEKDGRTGQNGDDDDDAAGALLGETNSKTVILITMSAAPMMIKMMAMKVLLFHILLLFSFSFSSSKLLLMIPLLNLCV